MAENKKRKAVYIDRAQILSDSRKFPNILPNSVALACDRKRKYSFASTFKYKISVPDNDCVLDAMVLENGICVLVTKNFIEPVKFLQFSSHLKTDSISGRLKKGALKIMAGANICSVATSDGSDTVLRTPVGGKLLELNEVLPLKPFLLESHNDSEGYLAVIYPDTEIPTLEGYSDYKTLIESFTNKNVGKNICYDFQKGTCKRGDSCRFKHIALQNE